MTCVLFAAADAAPWHAWFGETLAAKLLGIGVLTVMAVVLGLGLWAGVSETNVGARGKRVPAWVVMAADHLYQDGPAHQSGYAQVVFTLDPDAADLDKTLPRWAAKLRTYTPPEKPTEDERIIGSVLKTLVPYQYLLKLPAEVTGGAEGYTASVEIHRPKLPDGKLTRPYIFCKALPGAAGGALMVEYPAG